MAPATKYDASGAPRDAQSVAAILKAMGVEEYDERVVHQLLELLHRYVSEVLADALEYARHAALGASNGSGELSLADVKLAIEAKVKVSFTQPPPREVLMQLCREKNAVPLPVVEDKAVVALPPEEFQLTAPNYRVVAARSSKHRSGGGGDAVVVRERQRQQPQLGDGQRSAAAGGRDAGDASAAATPSAEGEGEREGEGDGEAVAGEAAHERMDTGAGDREEGEEHAAGKKRKR